MNERFLRACWREPVDRTPVWFLRQAGRSSPSYRSIRQKHGILEIAKDPALATEVALQPVHELGVDAAILFCDLLIPLEAMGASVRIERGTGPVLEPPVRTAEDVERFRTVDTKRDLPFVLETVRRLRTKLRVPLIGFAGAPFTLASYLIEGGATRDFTETKRFMYGYPGAWDRLLDLLAEGVAEFLRAQAGAGAQVLQVFDSWAGALSPQDYADRVAPHTRRVFAGVRETGVPIVHFGTGTAGFLEGFAAAGGDVIGIDWRAPLDDAWSRVSYGRGIQGNLDPSVLLGPPEVWRPAAADVLRRAAAREGHIFNLGHGVLPESRLEDLRGLVDFVHESTRR